MSFDYSPDDELLVIGWVGEESVGVLLDSVSGRELHRWPMDRWTTGFGMLDVKFFPDGSKILLTTFYAAVVYNVKSGRKIRLWEVKQRGCVVTAASISPDSSEVELWVGGTDDVSDYSVVYDVASGQELRRFNH